MYRNYKWKKHDLTQDVTFQHTHMQILLQYILVLAHSTIVVWLDIKAKLGIYQ